MLTNIRNFFRRSNIDKSAVANAGRFWVVDFSPAMMITLSLAGLGIFSFVVLACSVAAVFILPRFNPYLKSEHFNNMIKRVFDNVKWIIAAVAIASLVFALIFSLPPVAFLLSSILTALYVMKEFLQEYNKTEGFVVEMEPHAGPGGPGDFQVRAGNGLGPRATVGDAPDSGPRTEPPVFVGPGHLLSTGAVVPSDNIRNRRPSP